MMYLPEMIAAMKGVTKQKAAIRGRGEHAV
jgi:hypothetical protein